MSIKNLFINEEGESKNRIRGNYLAVSSLGSVSCYVNTDGKLIIYGMPSNISGNFYTVSQINELLNDKLNVSQLSLPNDGIVQYISGNISNYLNVSQSISLMNQYFTGYATINYVNEQISNNNQYYYTISQTNNAISSNLIPYITLSNTISLIDQSLVPYFTISQFNETISNYATISYVDSNISSVNSTISGLNVSFVNSISSVNSNLSTNYYNISQTNNLLTNFINVSQVGSISGVCPLDANSKIPNSFLPNGILQYIGQYDAITNTPNISNNNISSYQQGDVLIVNTSGTTPQGYAVIPNDWLIFNISNTWDLNTASNFVLNFNGRTGAISSVESDYSAFFYTISQTDNLLNQKPNISFCNVQNLSANFANISNIQNVNLTTTNISTTNISAQTLNVSSINATTISAQTLNVSNIQCNNISANTAYFSGNVNVSNALNVSGIIQGFNGLQIDNVNVSSTISANVLNVSKINANTISAININTSNLQTNNLSSSNIIVQNLSASVLNVSTTTIHDLTTTGNATLSSLTVSNSMTVYNDATISHQLTVNRGCFFNQNVNIANNLNLSGNLNNYGNATFYNNATVCGTLNVNTLNISNITLTTLSATNIQSANLSSNQISVSSLFATNISVSTANISSLQIAIGTISSSVSSLDLSGSNIINVSYAKTYINSLSSSITTLSSITISNFNSLSSSLNTTNSNLTTLSQITISNFNSLSSSLNTTNSNLTTLSQITISNYNTLSSSIATTNTNLNTLSAVTISNYNSLSSSIASLSGSLSNYLNISGGTITGNLTISGNLSSSSLSVSQANITTAIITNNISQLSITNLSAQLLRGATISYNIGNISNLTTANLSSSTITVSQIQIFIGTISSNVSALNLSGENLANVSYVQTYINNVSSNITTLSALTISNYNTLSSSIASLSGSLSNYLNISGGTITGNLSISGTATVGDLTCLTPAYFTNGNICNALAEVVRFATGYNSALSGVSSTTGVKLQFCTDVSSVVGGANFQTFIQNTNNVRCDLQIADGLSSSYTTMLTAQNNGLAKSFNLIGTTTVFGVSATSSTYTPFTIRNSGGTSGFMRLTLQNDYIGASGVGNSNGQIRFLNNASSAGEGNFDYVNLSATQNKFRFRLANNTSATIVTLHEWINDTVSGAYQLCYSDLQISGNLLCNSISATTLSVSNISASIANISSLNLTIATISSSVSSINLSGQNVANVSYVQTYINNVSSNITNLSAITISNYNSLSSYSSSLSSNITTLSAITISNYNSLSSYSSSLSSNITNLSAITISNYNSLSSYSSSLSSNITTLSAITISNYNSLSSYSSSLSSNITTLSAITISNYNSLSSYSSSLSSTVASISGSLSNYLNTLSGGTISNNLLITGTLSVTGQIYASLLTTSGIANLGDLQVLQPSYFSAGNLSNIVEVVKFATGVDVSAGVSSSTGVRIQLNSDISSTIAGSYIQSFLQNTNNVRMDIGLADGISTSYTTMMTIQNNGLAKTALLNANTTIIGISSIASSNTALNLRANGGVSGFLRMQFLNDFTSGSGTNSSSQLRFLNNGASTGEGNFDYINLSLTQNKFRLRLANNTSGTIVTFHEWINDTVSNAYQLCYVDMQLSGNLIAKSISATTMSISNISCTILSAGSISASTINCSSISSTIASIGSISASALNISSISCTNASIGNISASQITVSNISATNASIGTISSSYINTSGGILTQNISAIASNGTNIANVSYVLSVVGANKTIPSVKYAYGTQQVINVYPTGYFTSISSLFNNYYLYNVSCTTATSQNNFVITFTGAPTSLFANSGSWNYFGLELYGSTTGERNMLGSSAIAFGLTSGTNNITDNRLGSFASVSSSNGFSITKFYHYYSISQNSTTKVLNVVQSNCSGFENVSGSGFDPTSGIISKISLYYAWQYTSLSGVRTACTIFKDDDNSELYDGQLGTGGVALPANYNVYNNSLTRDTIVFPTINFFTDTGAGINICGIAFVSNFAQAIQSTASNADIIRLFNGYNVFDN